MENDPLQGGDGNSTSLRHPVVGDFSVFYHQVELWCVAAASQLHGSQPDPELGLVSDGVLHVLPVSVWVSSRLSGFLQPPPKHTRRSTGEDKLPLGVRMRAWCHAMEWHPVII